MKGDFQLTFWRFCMDLTEMRFRIRGLLKQMLLDLNFDLVETSDEELDETVDVVCEALVQEFVEYVKYQTLKKERVL